MIIHDIKQRSDEWRAIRAGKITASVASKLVTQTGRISTQYRKEIGRIIAERMKLQESEDIPETFWVKRGIELEREALAWFSVETGLVLDTCGFVEADDHMSGFSPDSLTGAGRYIVPVEVKVPKPSTHISWLVDGGMPAEHVAQVHFGMVITGSPHAYFMSYCPEVEPLILKVKWSEHTDLMAKQIESFTDELQTTYRQLTGKDYAND
jgi:hypothetical protein